MNDKLKKVIELANQLQEAVTECKDVISISIHSPIFDSEDYVLINSIDKNNLTGLEFHHQSKNGRWFRTKDYGIYIDGAVKGSDNE